MDFRRGQATTTTNVHVPTKAHIGDMLKRTNFVTATEALDTNAIGIKHLINDAQELQLYKSHLADSVAAQFDGAPVMAPEVFSEHEQAFLKAVCIVFALLFEELGTSAEDSVCEVLIFNLVSWLPTTDN